MHIETVYCYRYTNFFFSTYHPMKVETAWGVRAKRSQLFYCVSSNNKNKKNMKCSIFFSPCIWCHTSASNKVSKVCFKYCKSKCNSILFAFRCGFFSLSSSCSQRFFNAWFNWANFHHEFRAIFGTNFIPTCKLVHIRKGRGEEKNTRSFKNYNTVAFIY